MKDMSLLHDATRQPYPLDRLFVVYAAAPQTSGGIIIQSSGRFKNTYLKLINVQHN